MCVCMYVCERERERESVCVFLKEQKTGKIHLSCHGDMLLFVANGPALLEEGGGGLRP